MNTPNANATASSGRSRGFIAARKWGAALLLALSALPAAHAEEWYRVSKIEYTNRGAYLAEAMVEWRDKQSNSNADTHRTMVSRRTTHSFDASELDGKQHVLDEGEEFWLVVTIDARNETSCRNADARFLFDPEGGVVSYQTAGSILRGFRCKIRRKPGREYIVR